MEEDLYSNYYCVIPASVRYDKRLSNLSKLLYGELTTLSQKLGYSWASNKYFADLYETSERTIIRAINDLKECGYVDIHYTYKENSKEVQSRLIKILDPGMTKDDKEVVTKMSGGWCQICQGGGDKNVTDNNTSINNTSIKEKENIKRKRKSPAEEKVYTLGEFQNVKLTLPEIDKLSEVYGGDSNLDSAIDILDGYIEQSGHKYKSHYAVLRKNNWVYNRFFEKKR